MTIPELSMVVWLIDGLGARACSIHYFRIHPGQWEDRLLRVKALGLNAVQAHSFLLPAQTFA